MKLMRTNEINRIKADRNIPLELEDILCEFLGNLYAFLICFFITREQGIDKLYIYQNDNGFSASDKEAYFIKNQSGSDNRKTASINGHGEKLAIDRILPEDQVASVYSLNCDSYQKCNIGHFSHSEWEDIDHLELDYCYKKIEEMCGYNFPIEELKTGSLKIIPIKQEYDISIEMERIRKHCIKLLNIKISRDIIDFYWQGQKQTTKLICPDENSINIEYQFGADSSNSHLLKIINFDYIKEQLLICNKNIEPIIHIKKDITEMTKSLNNGYVLRGEFRIKEIGVLKSTVVKSEDDYDDCTIGEADGLFVYLNNVQLNWTPIQKKKWLGGKAEGVWGTEVYGGKPRFEHHISKDTVLYKLPPDKSNITPERIGIKILTFIRSLLSKKKVGPLSQEGGSVANTLVEEDDYNHDEHSHQVEDFLDENTDLVAHSLLAEDSLDTHSHQEENSLDSHLPLAEDSLNAHSHQTENSELDHLTDLDENSDNFESLEYADSLYQKDNIDWKLKTKIIHKWGKGKNIIECSACFKTMYQLKPNEIHMAHIIAESNGGTTTWDNLLPCCRGCNLSMGTMKLSDWVQAKYPHNYRLFEEKLTEYIKSTDFILDDSIIC